MIPIIIGNERNPETHRDRRVFFNSLLNVIMETSATSLYRLDFNEAQKIAALVNFDVMHYARRLRSCGPGCDYFSKDRKYFITMLLQHIRGLAQDQALPPEVSEWLEQAAAAEQESREIEKAYLEMRLGRKC
jgi:hypothetical protein